MKKALTLILAIALCCSTLFCLTGTVAAEEAQAVAAADSLTSAYSACGGNKDALDWSASQWKAEYSSPNNLDWTPMIYATDASDKTVKNTFSYNGLHAGQPAVYVLDGKIILLANQWGDGSWWDKSAVSYTCTQDGEYQLTCADIAPGHESAFTTAQGDGHLTLTKNGTKIWPTDKDYASVKKGASVTFEPMTLTLKSGDVIRFEGFGGKAGAGTDAANPNGWLNHIAINPSIKLIKAAEGSEQQTEGEKEEKPVDPLAGKTVYNAAKMLAETKAANNPKLNCWRAMYTDANCEMDSYKNLVINENTFAFKTIDFAMPYIRLVDNGIVLCANQWADGGVYWDMAALCYRAQSNQKILLRGGQNKKISNFAEGDTVSLTNTEGRVAIYVNSKKVWPTNKDYAIVNSKTSLDFPELELNLKAGDKLYIQGFGATHGKEITGDVKGEYRNMILMDPEVVVLDSTGGKAPYTGDKADVFVLLSVLIASTLGMAVLMFKKGFKEF